MNKDECNYIVDLKAGEITVTVQNVTRIEKRDITPIRCGKPAVEWKILNSRELSCRCTEHLLSKSYDSKSLTKEEAEIASILYE